MEVLHGNQSEPNHTRRKQDEHVNEQRCLNWLLSNNDIDLHPHSPLALADVLSTESGCFDLIAALETDGEHAMAEELHSVDTRPAVSSLQQRRLKKNPRQRANLLTKLDQKSLLEACKHILVENALVKHKGVKQLYLIAGFLNVTVEDSPLLLRAPLLFYPVTLTRKHDHKKTTALRGNANKNDAVQKQADKTEQEQQETPSDFLYEIRIDSCIPETNPLIAAECATHTNINIPEFDPSAPLQDYFAHLAASIADTPALELEFDVGLGITHPPINKAATEQKMVQMPDLPPHFDTALALTISKNRSVSQLNTVLHLIRDYSQEAPTSTKEEKQTPATNDSGCLISELHEYSKKLSSIGLATIEFQHLVTLPSNIGIWVSHATKGLSTPVVKDILNASDISPRHFIRLAGLIELIDKAPMVIDQYKHKDLCYAASNTLLQRARHQARLIEDELSTLQTSFVLDKVPAKKQLLNLIEELGGYMDQGPDIVDADYFGARRQFMEFSIEKPANLTPEHKRQLSQLAKVLRFRELFVNNTEYRLALGPGYRGLRTDWQALSHVVEYAQEFSSVLESESLAAEALHQWDDFRERYIKEFETLQAAAESLRKLLWICGLDWQSKPITALLAQATEMQEKLKEWACTYKDLTINSSKTPAAVLAQFTGQSHDDIITEIFVDETQNAIDKYIQSHKLSQEAVVDTLQWLSSASDLSLENELGIDAIIDNLQIS